MLAQFWALQCLLLGAALAGVIDLLPRQSDTNSNVDDSCGVIFDYVFQGLYERIPTTSLMFSEH